MTIYTAGSNVLFVDKRGYAGRTWSSFLDIFAPLSTYMARKLRESIMISELKYGGCDLRNSATSIHIPVTAVGKTVRIIPSFFYKKSTLVFFQH